MSLYEAHANKMSLSQVLQLYAVLSRSLRRKIIIYDKDHEFESKFY